MHCSKCGKWLPIVTKFCPKCGTAVSSEQRKRELLKFLILFAFALASAARCVYYGYNAVQRAGNPAPSTYSIVSGAVVLVLLIFGVGYWAIEFVRFIIRRPVRGSVAVAMILLLVVGGVYYYHKTESAKLQYNLNLIQESLTETAAAKEVGDILVAGKTDVPEYFNWGNIENVADNMANQMADLNSFRLDEYKKVAIAWSEKIHDAAEDKTTWKDVPEEPGDFKIKLKKDEASELFARSLVKIDELAQFGDYAVEREDKETMRYIAARLLVQKHWLNGLAHYEEAGIFAGLTSPVYVYAASQDICTFSKKDSPLCSFEMNKQLNEIRTKIDNLLVAAVHYTWGRADAKQKWLEASKQIVDMIEKQGSLSEETLKEIADIMQKEGILPGGPNEQKEEVKQPPKLQAFKDACSAKGGTLKETAPNEVGLPSLEHGYHCYFKEQQKNCWNFLTYSGSDAAGGDPGCDKSNLLPYDTSAQPEQSSTTTTQTKSAAQPAAPAAQPAVPKQTAPKPQLPDLGQPTGTAAPKIEFVLSQNTFNGNVGEPFQYSFCQPAVTRTSDLCTAASTNPRYGLPPYNFYLESGVGFLPYGLTLNLNGLLEGTPTAEGSRTVGICAKDAGGFSVCRRITINVEPKAAAEPVTPAKNQPETWQGTITTSGRCECSSASHGCDPYGNGGELSGSFTFTFTLPGSLVQALKSSGPYEPGNPGPGKGTFNGSEIVAVQSNRNDCQLGGGSAVNVPITVIGKSSTYYPGFVAVVSFDTYDNPEGQKGLLAGGWLTAHMSNGGSAPGGQVSGMSLLIPSISDTQMSGKVSFTDPGTGTFTLTKVK